MLHRARWIGTFGILGLLLAPLGLGAETSTADQKAKPAPAVAPEKAVAHGWDDSHMRSNFHNAANKVTRPPIQVGTAETRMTVPETLETTTQRNWEQGPLNPAGPKAQAKGKTGGGSGISRSSKLRAGAVTNR